MKNQMNAFMATGKQHKFLIKSLEKEMQPAHSIFKDD